MNSPSEFVDYLAKCIYSEYNYIQDKFKSSKIIGCEVVVDGDVVSAFIRFSLRDKSDDSQLQWINFDHDIYLTSKESLVLEDSMLSFGRSFLKFNESKREGDNPEKIRDRNIKIYIDGLLAAKRLTKSDAIFYFCEDGEEELKILSMPILNENSPLVDEYLNLWR